MSFETCQRIKWRLEENYKAGERIPYIEVMKAVWKEAGLDSRTVEKYINVMRKLGWLKRISRTGYELCTEID